MRFPGILAALFASSWGIGGVGHPASNRPTPESQNQDRLVAPVYPAAIEVEGWAGGFSNAQRRAETCAFLSKDRMAKVRSFYEEVLGPFESVRLHAAARIVMTSEGVADIRRYRDSSAGIEILSVEPKRSGRPDRYPAVGRFFEKLLIAVGIGEAEADDYDSVVEKYEDLAWLYYPLTAETTGDGERLTMDEVVFNECQKKAQGGMSTEEAQEKIQQLAMQGKLEEAQKLAEKVLGMGSGSKSWDIWVECLDGLAEQGFQTLILIDKHPSLWE